MTPKTRSLAREREVFWTERPSYLQCKNIEQIISTSVWILTGKPLASRAPLTLRTIVNNV